MTGPFARADDPVERARESLARGAEAAVVARLYLAPAIRRRRLAALRKLLAECGAYAAFEDALDAEMAARGEAA